jgi:hypothetical protein
MIIRRATYWFLIALAIVTTWFFSARFGAAITSGTAAPEIAGESWLNSKPLTIADLKGRVVLVDFWTYG